MLAKTCSCIVLLASVFSASTSAQTARDAAHMVPTGKGWGAEAMRAHPPFHLPLSQPGGGAGANNGILYHGGAVMPGTVNLYFIWYGNFSSGPAASDTNETVRLLTSLFSVGGLGGTPWSRINSTYYDASHPVSGNFALAASASDNYSHGKQLSDSGVAAVVAAAINQRLLPKDANGVYFVLSSSDVAETSGFCSKYCGWHSHMGLSGADIKIAFIGNPDRCPTSCEEQLISPNSDSGADSMASVMAHETQEAISDPDLNAWYDLSGNENADKCAWKWGPVTGIPGNGAWNMTAAGRNWLIQMNWENSRGGGCDLTLGGKFYGR